MTKKSPTRGDSSSKMLNVTSIAGISTDDVLRALPDAVIIVDTSGTIRFATDSMCSLSGYSQEELIDQPVTKLVPEVHRKAHARHQHRFSTSPTPRSMGADVSTSLLHEDGTEIAVDIGLGAIQVESEWWTIASVRNKSAEMKAEVACPWP